MRQVFLVSERHGGPWDWSKGLREQQLFDEHARFMDALVEQGTILLGGPLDDRDVLLVIDAESVEAVHAQLAPDPWLINGMLSVVEVRPWTILLEPGSA